MKKTQIMLNLSEVWQMVRKSRSPSPLAEKLAELAVRVWKRDRAVVEDIKRIAPGCEIGESEYGLAGKGPGGMTVGIQYGLEPPLAVIQLGFLCAGPAWPTLGDCKDALALANRMWREETKKHRSATKILKYE